MEERFDAIVVGAGPAGNAAAYTMAKAGLKVLQLERGEYPGSKNVQGAILYADALEKIIPDFREDAPLERHVIEQRIWMMDDTSHTGMHYRSEDFNEEKPNRYTIIRAQFDRWFSSKVREAGGIVLCETTVAELVKDTKGHVIGVLTDRHGGPLLADVVVMAEGVNGLVGQRAGLRDELKPQAVALAVKEMHFLPQEVVESRFNLSGDAGVVIEAMGAVSKGMVGTGFLYTNRESISVGIGCIVEDLAKSGVTPYSLLDQFKAHPSIAPLIAGAEVKEYAAHLIPEGGFRSMPAIYGGGWVVTGDAAHLVNSVHREGSNLAMTSGRIAAETIIWLKRRREPCSFDNLAEYRKRLEASFVLKDMRKYQKIPGLLHNNRQLLNLYPRMLSGVAQSWLRVDGKAKRSKETEIFKAVRKQRGLVGLVADGLRLARAWR
ncbi:MAG: FAD-dependent monooxygenase [Acetobacteraceae bacterium]|nr:FAD-dependent monooxygenase [Acetobacteraceae bacterium]